jgi:uncharacterized protein YecE (DUF72 family)
VRVLTGTSGWSYPAWRGPFYPADLPPRRMLSAYASLLPTVEVNATAYRMPRAAMLAGWRAQVGPGFVFAVKAPQRITHGLRLRGTEEPLSWFYRAAAELGDALGPVLFQLPPSLKKDLPLLAEFLALLPRGARSAFQLQHPSWRSDDVLSALAAAGAAVCAVDAEGEPPPLEATAPFGYLRLRRPDYDDAALAAWAARIVARPWAEAFVFLKHEDEARGPRFALRLAAILEQAGAQPTAQ